MAALDYLAVLIVGSLLAAFGWQVGRELYNFRNWCFSGADEYLPVATVISAVVIIAWAVGRVMEIRV